MKNRIAILASGEGTNFEAIVAASRRGDLAAEICGLIVNRKQAVGALSRAQHLGIRSEILSPKGFKSREEWDAAMLRRLSDWQADWVVLAGFLVLIGPQVLQAYPNRVVNSHPSLLPKYGGEGMYGDRVHEAVLSSGEQETGLTIHLLDEEYDRGDILFQERVKVETGDSVEQLSHRVKTREREIYPRVLNDLVTGTLKIR